MFYPGTVSGCQVSDNSFADGAPVAEVQFLDYMAGF